MSRALTFSNPEKKAAEDNERYNYGHKQSLRESWSQGRYQRYFQMLDKDMYLKVLQQRIIDAIADSLEERGIATDAIREQETTILNQGLIMTGGKIDAQNLAVGHKAGAAIRQAFSAMSRSAPSAQRSSQSL